MKEGKVSKADIGVRKIIRDDLIGVDDWKRSKIGFLTGYSAAKRAVGSFGSSVKDSSSRISTLWGSIFTKEELPSLPEGGEPDERFVAALRLYQVTGDKLHKMRANTRRATYLYATLSFFSICAGIISLVLYPTSSAISAIMRLGLFPLVAALTFKHAFTNWIVRTKRLGTPGEFIKSMDWFPK